MTPGERRKVEAIATQMTTPVSDIMSQLRLHPRDRGEVANIVAEKRRGRK